MEKAKKKNAGKAPSNPGEEATRARYAALQKELKAFLETVKPKTDDDGFEPTKEQASQLLGLLSEVSCVGWEIPEIRESTLDRAAEKVARVMQTVYCLGMEMHDLADEERAFLLAKAEGMLPDLDAATFGGMMTKEETEKPWGAALQQKLKTDGAEILVQDWRTGKVSLYVVRAGKLICLNSLEVPASPAPILYKGETICVVDEDGVLSAHPGRLRRFRRWNPLGKVNKPCGEYGDDAKVFDALARDLVNEIELADDHGDGSIAISGAEMPGGLVEIAQQICSNEKMTIGD